MTGEWEELERRLWAAGGSEAEIDRILADDFSLKARAYTASVEDARALVAEALPDWHLHLGYGASGVFPYALLARGDSRIVSDGPTVPLAILRSALAARAADQAPAAPPPA
ncbi:hypothetical protein [Paramagnetospirillum marisnigri]|uniref:hypothetical protein n=1 Tax=Paramagnetospirillum marisnigri TaxID=1285242 RepID=UPI0009EE013E|nr:hypothetical protein [Paramagnetospirillum marisnigri]